jgi:hypothetical protein
MNCFQHAEVVVVMQQMRAEDLRYFRSLKSDQVCIDLARTLNAEEVGGEYWSMDTPDEKAHPLRSSPDESVSLMLNKTCPRVKQ